MKVTVYYLDEEGSNREHDLDVDGATKTQEIMTQGLEFYANSKCDIIPPHRILKVRLHL